MDSFDDLYLLDRFVMLLDLVYVIVVLANVLGFVRWIRSLELIVLGKSTCVFSETSIGSLSLFFYTSGPFDNLELENKRADFVLGCNVLGFYSDMPINSL